MLDSAHQGLVVAVHEAELPAGQCAALRQAYAAALDRGIPSGIIQTFLVPGPAEGTPWRLVVVWGSRRALEAYREANALPGVAIFRAAGCQPRQSVADLAS
jgi:hypothetical protein